MGEAIWRLFAFGGLEEDKILLQLDGDEFECGEAPDPDLP